MLASVRRAIVCCAYFVLAFAGEARAEGKPIFEIGWPDVAGCPTKQKVTALAARAAAGEGAIDPVRARVEVRSPPSRGDPWRVRIRTWTIRGNGERELEAGTCDELARATALLVALAALRTSERTIDAPFDEIFPDVERQDGPPLLAGHPVRLSVDAPKEAPAVEDAAFLAGAGFFADGGALPRVAFGPSLWLDYRLSSYRARVTFVFAFTQEELQGTLGATFGLFGAAFDLCRSIPLVVRPHACIGGQVEQLKATGIGDQRFDSTRTSGFVFGGFGAEWAPSSRIRIGLDARIGPALRQSTFVVELASGERRLLHEPSSIRTQAIASLGLVF